MLDLKSSRWQELVHAYGSATDMPALLLQLRELPESKGNAEPWFSIWSSLAHQGDIYSASFAAVPHVISALAKAPSRADEAYFQFPVWVEICRVKNQVAPPDDLKADYFESLAMLPDLVASAACRDWTPGFLACALAAIAVAKGQPQVAEAVIEISSPEIAQEFLEWHMDQ